ncbi:MAG: hypothetical protein CL885_00840 [Dehalococcoidia bacterium]|nr:hypothetical protein [Dehalococcoidia bacterium]
MREKNYAKQISESEGYDYDLFLSDSSDDYPKYDSSYSLIEGRIRQTLKLPLHKEDPNLSDECFEEKLIQRKIKKMFDRRSEI